MKIRPLEQNQTEALSDSYALTGGFELLKCKTKEAVCSALQALNSSMGDVDLDFLMSDLANSIFSLVGPDGAVKAVIWLFERRIQSLIGENEYEIREEDFKIICPWIEQCHIRLTCIDGSFIGIKYIQRPSYKVERLSEIKEPIVSAGNFQISNNHEIESLPSRTNIDGALEFIDCDSFRWMPDMLTVHKDLCIVNCPEFRGFGSRLQVGGMLIVAYCKQFTVLPRGSKLNDDVRIYCCENFAEFPEGLLFGSSIYMAYLPAFRALKGNFRIPGSLLIKDCENLETIGDGVSVMGAVSVAGCRNLKSIPAGWTIGGYLDITGCESLDGFKRILVGGDILIDETQIVRVREAIISKELKILGDVIMPDRKMGVHEFIT